MQPYLATLITVRDRSLLFLRINRMYVALGAGAVLVAVIALLTFSLWALPGTPLYGVKTRVLEPIARIVRVTPGMQASYSIHILERRLRELEALSSDNATTTPETLGTFAALVRREVNRADGALANDSVAPENALDLHLRILSAADAHQTVARASLEFEPVEEEIEDARGDAYRAFETSARTFATTSPEAAGSYLGEQLNILSEELKGIGRGSEAETRAQSRLSDALDAMATGDVGDALIFVLRARQAIAVDAYLFDSERGPQKGVDLPPPTNTEGQ